MSLDEEVQTTTRVFTEDWDMEYEEALGPALSTKQRTEDVGNHP